MSVELETVFAQEVRDVILYSESERIPALTDILSQTLYSGSDNGGCSINLPAFHAVLRQHLETKWQYTAVGFSTAPTEAQLSLLLDEIQGLVEELERCRIANLVESAIRTKLENYLNSRSSVVAMPLLPRIASTTESGFWHCNHLLVDRPLSEATRQVTDVFFLDILRHRLDFELLKDAGKHHLYALCLGVLDKCDTTAQEYLCQLLLDRRFAAPAIAIPSDNSISVRSYLPALEWTRSPKCDGCITTIIKDSTLTRICVIANKSRPQSAKFIERFFGLKSLYHFTGLPVEFPKTLVEFGCGHHAGKDVIIIHVVGTVTHELEKWLLQVVHFLIVEEVGSAEPESTEWATKQNKSDWSGIPILVWQRVDDDASLTVSGNLTVIRGLLSSDDFESLITPRLSSSRANASLDPILTTTTAADLFNGVQTSVQLPDVKDMYRYNPATIRSSVLLLQKSFQKEANAAIRAIDISSYEEENRAKQTAMEEKEYRNKQFNIVKNEDLLALFIRFIRIEGPQIRYLAFKKLEIEIAQFMRATMDEIDREKDLKSAARDVNRDDRQLVEQYIAAKQKSLDTVFQPEHLWREFALLYVTEKSMARNGNLAVQSLQDAPKLACMHLLDGFALELLDGDAGKLNHDWVLDVLDTLDKLISITYSTSLASSSSTVAISSRISRLRSPRVLVLSIVGVQSSGKSTFLNYLFGCRFRVSVSRCTRGVNMQLIRVEGRTNYDYVILLDTEGVQSSETIGTDGAVRRDNRLVAFATWLSDATIVMINGEEVGTVKDIIPLVADAYRSSTIMDPQPFRLSFVFRGMDTKASSSQLRRECNNLYDKLLESLKVDGPTAFSRETVSQDQDAHESTNFGNMHDFLLGKSGFDKDKDIVVMGHISHGDSLNYEYGTSVLKVGDRIHERLQNTGWRPRTLADWRDRVALVWNAIERANLYFNFPSAVLAAKHRRLTEIIIKLEQRVEAAHGAAVTSVEQAVTRIERKEIDSIKGPGKADDNLFNHFQNICTDNAYKLGVNQCNIEEQQLWTDNDGEFEQWRELMHLSWESYLMRQSSVAKDRIRQIVMTRIIYRNPIDRYCDAIRTKLMEAFNISRAGGNDLASDTVEKDRIFRAIFNEILEATNGDQPLSQVFAIPNFVIDQFRSQCNSRDFAVPEMVNQEIWYGKINQMRKMLMTSTDPGMIKKLRDLFRVKDPEPDKDPMLIELFAEVNAIIEETIESPKLCITQAITALRRATNDLHGRANCSSGRYRRAHNMVYTQLTSSLMKAEEYWEQEHSVRRLLLAQETNLREFFDNVVCNLSNADLLKNELKRNITAQLGNAYNGRIVSLVKISIRGGLFPWLKYNRAMQARLDIDLLKTLRSNNDDKLYTDIRNPGEHYRRIVDHHLLTAIRQLIAPGAQNWPNFATELRNSLEAAVRQAQTGPGTDRVRRLLVSLRTAPTALPPEIADAIPATDSADTTYSGCNSDAAEAFNAFTSELKACIPSDAPQVTEDNILEAVRRACVADAVIRNRCIHCCPLCGLLCNKASGHNGKHDTDHQPQGLGLTALKSNDANIHGRLVWQTCVKSKMAKQSFYPRYDEEQLHPYTDYHLVFTEWEAIPDVSVRLEIREHIFAAKQELLVKRYGKKEFKVNPDVPPEYLRSPEQLNELEGVLTEIMNTAL